MEMVPFESLTGIKKIDTLLEWKEKLQEKLIAVRRDTIMV
jgi:hypothetical protein